MKGNIKTFEFSRSGFDEIKRYHFGVNWPSVYLIENAKEIYIGEAVNVFNRSRQHYESVDRRRLDRIHLITDDEFNKSAALDVESLLIQYMIADGKFVLQNKAAGLVDHNYFDKEKYRAKFDLLWDELKAMSLVSSELVDIRNTNLFKFSPYKALTEDQNNVGEEILKHIKASESGAYIVNGGPGTGKTILATHLVKRFKEIEGLSTLKIGLVVPMTSLRGSLQKVFKKVPGLKADMVIGPTDVVGGNYDVLIVDESHRLRQRINITNFKSFDDANNSLGLDKTGTELDWIMKSSRYQIFFYDKNQSVKPSDIKPSTFETIKARPFYLTSQKRVLGGEEYIQFIDDILNLRVPTQNKFEKYDFKVFDDIEEMISGIKRNDGQYKLCRVVAGYAWDWKTKDGSSTFDIEIDGLQLVWNSTNSDWVNSPNALNEVGCIHTIQGYDLNYTGVIIGPELAYDSVSKKIVIDKEKYKDINGKRSIDDPKELERYIINIYKTLLTRGIRGTYVYIVDPALRDYFKSRIAK
jgi:DUF2075 family protein